jgi:hypothetical protein
MIQANFISGGIYPPGADCVAYLIRCLFNSKVSFSLDKDRTTSWEHLLKSAIKAGLDSIIYITIYKEDRQLS